MDLANINGHISESPAPHFEAIIKRLSKLENDFRGITQQSAGSTADGNVISKLAEVERRQKVVEDMLLKLRSTKTADGELGAVGGTGFATAAAGGAAASAGGIDVDAILDKLVLYEGVITVLNREMENLTNQVSACDLFHPVSVKRSSYW